MELSTHKIYPQDALTDEAFEELKLFNPKFQKHKDLGLSTRGVPKYLYMYQERDNEVLIPREYELPKEYINKEAVGKVIDNREEGKDVKFNSKITPRKEQAPAIDKMSISRNGILHAGCGVGKGHTLDTELYTPQGKKELGNIEVGDEVIGSDGKPTRVTNIFDRGKLPTYKVTFSDGTELLCDGEHLFSVKYFGDRTKGKDRWRVKEVRELKDDLFYGSDKSHRRSKWYIPIVKPVEFNENEVDIDPYLLGILLAEGSLREVGMVSISNGCSDVIERLEETVDLNKKNEYDYDISGGYKLKPELKRLGLLGKVSYEKFIPKEYKYNSKEVRLEILRGLFDGDGSIEDTQMFYYTTSKRLAEDVAEVVRSLGGIASIKDKKTSYTYKGERKKGRKAYAVRIKMNEKPFSSDKHSDRFVEKVKYKKLGKNIKGIEYVGEKEIRCITVEAEDSLYCAEGFTVTHNTVMMLDAISRIGKTTLVLVHKTFLLEQWKDRIEEFLGEEAGVIQGQTCDYEGKKIVIGMLQSLVNYEKYPEELFNYFGVVVTDEVHRISSDTWKQVIQLFPAKRRYGLTATMNRPDGLEVIFKAHIGDVLYRIEGEDLEPDIFAVSTGLTNSDVDINKHINRYTKKIHVPKLITTITKQDFRNQLIYSYLSDAVESGRQVLVLSHRVDHLKEMQKWAKEKYGNEYSSMLYIGATKREQRKLAGEYDMIFATMSLVKEGLDIPSIDTLFMTTPTGSSVTVQQAVGRILREYPDKKKPFVVDFVDKDIGICQSLFGKRKTIYKKLNYDVTEVRGN